MIIKGYDWAENRAKLERAIGECREIKGDKFTEEDVKKVYRRLLGFVLGEDERIPVSKDLEGLTSAQLYSLAKKKEKLEKGIEKEEEEAQPMTKEELMAELDEKGIEYKPTMKKSELEALLNE